MECEQNLCTSCGRAHLKMKSSCDHHLVSLTDRQTAGEGQVTSKSFCDKHKGEWVMLMSMHIHKIYIIIHVQCTSNNLVHVFRNSEIHFFNYCLTSLHCRRPTTYPSFVYFDLVCRKTMKLCIVNVFLHQTIEHTFVTLVIAISKLLSFINQSIANE